MTSHRESALLTNFKWGFTGETQSMLVQNGRVVWRRSSLPQPAPSVSAEGPREDDLRAEKPREEPIVDMSGKWFMPSFIDAHCHILPTGLDLQKLHLGGCETHEDVLGRIRDWLPKLQPGRWLHAVHYDQTRYPGGDHLTRYHLDKVSADVPILLRHVSGHASIANTAALTAAGIREDEPDFSGGTFRRDASGVIDGVLLEHAHEKVSNAAPHPTLDDMVAAILLAGDRMADLGISCASDMMTGRFDLPMELEAYRLAAERGCRIRTRLYMQWGAVFGGRRVDQFQLRELSEAMDPDRSRIAGIKIFADGAIGSGTAAIYGQYAGGPPPPNPPPPPQHDPLRKGRGAFSGTLMYRPERLNEMVRVAHEAGYQVAIHSIGDYSTDLVMDALEATGDASRHRIEHAMLLSDAQIERLARLGCYVTMQPEFLIRFAHAYLAQLGPERRSHLKRFRSVWDAGIPLSFSSDRPIVAGDPRDGIVVLTHRPEGYEAAENISPKEAWLGYTARAAAVNGDGDMGALTQGQLADYQLLDTNPLPQAFSAEA